LASKIDALDFVLLVCLLWFDAGGGSYESRH
jgi:hypothetical protein